MVPQTQSTREQRRTGVRRYALAAGALGAGSAVCVALMRFADRPLAQHFRSHDGLLFRVAAHVTHLGEALWWLLPALAVYVGARLVWRSPLWAGRALFVFAGVAAPGLTADLLKPLLGRARPTLLFTQHIYGFSYLHFASAYESFPSGHAACTVGAGVALSLCLPRYRALWITMGLLLAFTRVIVTAHYVSDVLASAMLATWIVFAIHGLFVRLGMLPAGRQTPTAQTPTATARSALAARLLGRSPAAAPPGVATHAASMSEIG